MRDLIDKSKMLFEMPYLITGSIDFGLGDTENNMRIAKELISNNYTVIEEDELHILAYSGTLDKGIIFLYNNEFEILDYYVEYEAKYRYILGYTVTQVALFKRIDSGYRGTSGIIFFDYLLKKYNGVVSDKSQSEDGKKFWLSMMGEASRKGFKIGLRYGDQDIIYNKNTDGRISDWVQNIDAYGNTSEYTDKRFFILR